MLRREHSTCRVEARDKKVEQGKEKSAAPQQWKQHPKSQRWVNHNIKRPKAPSSCCRSSVGNSFCLWPAPGTTSTVSLRETVTRAAGCPLLRPCRATFSAAAGPCAGQHCWLQGHLCPIFGLAPVHPHHPAPSALSPKALGKSLQVIYTVSKICTKSALLQQPNPLVGYDGTCG